MEQIAHNQWVDLLKSYYSRKEIPHHLININILSPGISCEYLEYKEEILYRDIPSLKLEYSTFNKNDITDQNDSPNRKSDFNLKWLKFLPPLIYRQKAFNLLYF